MTSNNMSEGRKMAFERWRADVYVEDKNYRAQKSELGDLILQAKELVEESQKLLIDWNLINH